MRAHVSHREESFYTGIRSSPCVKWQAGVAACQRTVASGHWRVLCGSPL